MSTRTDIYDTAREQNEGWTIIYLSPIRRIIHWQRGTWEIWVEFSRANTVLWAGLYHDDAIVESFHPQHCGKREAVVGWMQRQPQP